MNTNSPAGNKGLNARQAEVQTSTFVLLFNVCANLNICASNPALRQAQNRYRSGKTNDRTKTKTNDLN